MTLGFPTAQVPSLGSSTYLETSGRLVFIHWDISHLRHSETGVIPLDDRIFRTCYKHFADILYISLLHNAEIQVYIAL